MFESDMDNQEEKEELLKLVHTNGKIRFCTVKLITARGQDFFP